MKKQLLILFLGMALFCSPVRSQIPNPGFEDLLVDSGIQYWGNVYLFSVGLDSAGNFVGDSILFDGPRFFLYGYSTDAHSGNYALEMRNAFNVTTGQSIAGAAGADDDSSFLGFGPANLLPISFAPNELRFYYKYSPQSSDDSAYAKLFFFDSAANEIGSALFVITGSSSTYQLATAPVYYSDPSLVAFYSLFFGTTYSLADYRQATFGTRLLIDDVSFDTQSGISSTPPISATVFPNPVSDILRVRLSSSISGNLMIINAQGKVVVLHPIKSDCVDLDISSLASGQYTLSLQSGTSSYSRKFIVK